MDRITHLPEPIVHHILNSFRDFDCPPVYLVRMSVLSKKWFDLTASFPVLDFSIVNFRSPESFFKYVEYTTSRFCQKNVTAQMFKLSTFVQEHAEVDTVNRCLELVLQNGVRELDIFVHSSSESPMPMYRLPNILLSVSVLKSLSITNCELPSSLMDDAVNLKSLVQLTLLKVKMVDEEIKYLIVGCPLLQDLEIVCCYGFKCFCVSGHQNLQNVFIRCKTPLERIDVEAPNLCGLMVHIEESGPPQMNMASCKKLTTVTYNGHPLPNHFLSNFPFVEAFSLVTLDTCNNLKWSSHSLRILMLISDCDLEEIELNTPNLLLFINGSLSRMESDVFWPFLGDSTHLKTCMQCYPGGCIDVPWFQKLRLFLDKKNGFKVSNLHIHMTQESVEFEEIYAIELPPYELEQVVLQLDTHEKPSTHLAFVDVVLWCCRPQCLTLRSSFPLTDSEDVKFICDTLLEQEDQGHTNIQIITWQGGKTVSFIKKEVVQEEAG